MTWVVEEPLYVAIIGILTIAILGFGWIQTGFRSLLYALIGVGVLTGLLLVVERLVQTENEQLEAALLQMARDVERNDLDAVLDHISTQAVHARNQAKKEFPRYTFKRVKVKRNLNIRIERQRQPLRAVLSFNVVVIGSHKNSGGSFHAPRFVKITLIEEDGRWRLLDYEHHRPHYEVQLGQ